MPALVAGTPDIAARLFGALAGEEAGVVGAVREAMTPLAKVCACVCVLISHAGIIVIMCREEERKGGGGGQPLFGVGQSCHVISQVEHWCVCVCVHLFWTLFGRGRSRVKDVVNLSAKDSTAQLMTVNWRGIWSRVMLSM